MMVGTCISCCLPFEATEQWEFWEMDENHIESHEKNENTPKA